MKCAIVHYRVGRTDGVSLEIAKRKRMLENAGYSVFLVGGDRSLGADLIIPELEFDSPEIRCIKENAFAYFKRSDLSSDELMAEIERISDAIKSQFMEFQKEEHIDCLFVHNIFSHGRHIAAASAFAHIAEELNIPVVATHHDFYWERPDYSKVTSHAVYDYLQTFVPARLLNIDHICINSQAAVMLEKRFGVKPHVLGDIFDFGQKPWDIYNFNSDLISRLDLREDDLVVLHATRLVRRKAVELAVQFVQRLSYYRDKLVGQRLYNDKLLTADSRIVLVLSGYAEDSSREYEVELQKFIAESGIEFRYADDLVEAERTFAPVKRYALSDFYAIADMVTYTSLQEGWGNQFIEAMFARRPIVLFEYPVFISDIKAEGYNYISLGNQIAGAYPNGLVYVDRDVIDKASGQTVSMLTSDSTAQLLKQNFNIGKENHSCEKFYSLIQTIFS